MADRIKEEYKRLACYREMDRTYQEDFDKLAKHYGEMLNRGPAQTITVYTSHDFDRHCFDLYRIISMYLLREEGIRQLTQEELYLLNLSVLLHDISMCRGGYVKEANTVFNRDIHSLQSAQWIRHEFDQGNTPLCQSGLTADQVEIICDICKAHSTLKDRETPTGLFDPELKYKKDGKTGEIRVKALAGILRVADELDVTRHRLANADEMDRLLTADDGRPETQTFIRENKKSFKHFRRLLLIRKLERCKDNTTQLALRLDRMQAEKRKMAGDEINLADDLHKIKSKIQSELDTLWNEVIFKEAAEARLLTTVRTMVWTEEDEQYIHSLRPAEIPDSPIDIRPVREEPTGASETPEGTESKPPSAKEPGNTGMTIDLLDSSLPQEIGRFVRERHLLHVGHYKLNLTYCARDWIDTEQFMDDSELVAGIIGAFSDHICTSYRTEEFTIVGLDLLGARVAAQIGFILQKPFTYVIPAHQHEESDSHEVDIPDIPAGHKVILVTDSIITGLTTADIIQKNGWEERVLAVYTVFYRMPKAVQEVEPACFSCEVHALNVDFPAEIALADNCPYGDKNFCQAVNQKLK